MKQKEKQKEKQKDSTLTHLDADGRANMVDISTKDHTSRVAVASAQVHMQASTMQAIEAHTIGKGEVLAVARVAGIQAAKRCSDLIPLCHPLSLTKVNVQFTTVNETTLGITAECRVQGQTGVEMEALTAVSVAALTVYDMCKAIDKGMHVEHLRLIEKRGGKSGHWQRDDADE